MKKIEAEVRVRELKIFREIVRIFPLVCQLNPDIDERSFRGCLKRMLKEGYRCIGAFSRKSDSLIGCAGFWTGTRFWCGAFIEPDNVVVDRAHRSMGIGKKLMEWIEREGLRRKCRILKLETYTVNTNARRFYGQKAYEEPGVVMVKPLLVDAEEWRLQLGAKVK